MSLNKLEIIKKNDVTLTPTFTDENDDFVDISSANLVFTVKDYFDSATASISKAVASGLHTDPTNGITEINLTDDETDISAGDYYYDIELTFGDGRVNSTKYGKLIIKEKIT